MNTAFHHRLLDLPKFGDGVGLHRVAFMMRALDLDPAQAGAKSIVITGSNGKGGTAKIAAELLAASARKVGLFTSPHLYRFNERFQIDGVPVDEGELAAAMDAVAQAVDAYQAQHGDAVGAFEAQFVAALLVFERASVGWQVLEAGIGGRFDPVRMVRSPVVGLVSLDLEHTELLGKTLIDIACDKLDAAPPGATVVLGESCSPFAEQITTFAGLADRQTIFLGQNDWRDLGVEDGRQTFDLAVDGLDLRGLTSALVGRHQINNHAVAARLVLERLRRSQAALPEDLAATWRSAIAKVAWPGRLERVSDWPPVYVDVGHTPQGVRAALDAFRSLHNAADTILVTGGSRNKSVGAMIDILAPGFRRIITTAAHHNGADAEAVKAMVAKANPTARTTAAASIEEAARLALDEASRSGQAVYVAGGLFLAAEFAAVLKGLDPLSLRFF